MTELALSPAWTTAPTPLELRDSWAESHGAATDEFVALDGVLGVVREPDFPVDSILSVDLCEVIRNTGANILQELNTLDADGRRWFEPTNEYGLGGHSEAVIDHTVRLLMNEGRIEPMEDYQETAELLRVARGLGILVVANTSTIEGCELATVDKRALAKWALGSFDGILFPRGHDGTRGITKVEAIARMATQLEVEPASVAVSFVDDTAHHHVRALERSSEFRSMTLVSPRNVGNEHYGTPATLYDWPSDAVEAAIDGIIEARAT